MRKNRYTLDELLEELRGQGFTGVEEVKYAVLENSGHLSVLPWARCQPPTAEQLGVAVEENVTLPVVLVNDGRLLRRNLEAQGLDEAWLREALRKEGLSSHREAFLVTVDETGRASCVKKEGPL